MTLYHGGRGLEGAVVTADGSPLDPRLALHGFSRTGFEWGYEGDGPHQLALALLAHHLDNDARALALAERFMRAVVAELDNEWQMDSAEVARAVEELG